MSPRCERGVLPLNYRPKIGGHGQNRTAISCLPDKHFTIKLAAQNGRGGAARKPMIFWFPKPVPFLFGHAPEKGPRFCTRRPPKRGKRGAGVAFCFDGSTRMPSSVTLTLSSEGPLPSLLWYHFSPDTKQVARRPKWRRDCDSNAEEPFTTPTV